MTLANDKRQNYYLLIFYFWLFKINFYYLFDKSLQIVVLQLLNISILYTVLYV